MILSYKLKGPQKYNDCLIVGYEIDRLGLNTCILFYVIDYFSQVLIVVLVIFLQRSSLAQLLICFVIYSVYLVFYYKYMPYESDLDDHMAVFN
jgi:hypothetical protein